MVLCICLNFGDKGIIQDVQLLQLYITILIFMRNKKMGSWGSYNIVLDKNANFIHRNQEQMSMVEFCTHTQKVLISKIKKLPKCWKTNLNRDKKLQVYSQPNQWLICFNTQNLHNQEMQSYIGRIKNTKQKLCDMLQKYNQYLQLFYLIFYCMSKQPGYLKMSDIISLSNNYKTHRNNVLNIKPAIDFSNRKRDNSILKLRTERQRYNDAIRNFNHKQLDRQNFKVIQRLQRAKKSSRNLSALSPKKSLSKSPEDSMKRSTIKSSSSQVSIRSYASNFRTRTMKQYQIQQQNKKIAQRIQHPSTTKYFQYSRLNDSYRKAQQISKIRSRYSDRNQKIVKSLALNGMNLSRESLKFLPQINYKTINAIQKINKKKNNLKMYQ